MEKRFLDLGFWDLEGTKRHFFPRFPYTKDIFLGSKSIRNTL